MRTKWRMLRVVTALILAWWVCGPCAGAAAGAGTYYFPRVIVEADVAADGSMWITERRTYAFTGAFSWATYTLRRAGWSNATEVTVSDEGGRYTLASSGAPRTYQVALSPQELEVKWHFRAADETKTFIIRYHVGGVVTRYRDTAEVFWQFIGDGWDVPTNEAHITVRIPDASRADLRAWGHGPLNGVVALHDGAVTLDVTDLAPETLVEARILFAPSLAPGARFVNQQALPRILADESGRARAANLVRWTPLLNALMFPLAIGIALAVWLTLYVRHGKEHRADLAQAYIREPPESYRPAILGALLHWGSPGRQDFAATVLDLAHRGFLTIRQEDDGVFRFTRTTAPDRSLTASEHAALALLFRWAPGKNTVTDREFRAAALRHTDASRMFKQWQRAVEVEAKVHRFFDEESRRTQRRADTLYGLIAAGGVALTVLAMVVFKIWLFTGFVAFPIGGALLLMLKGPLLRRTEEGATQLAQWRAFRRFLTDFSALKDVPPPAIAVWESYLPYAVSLGVAERVIRQFPAVYGDVPPTHTMSWYSSTSAIGGQSRGGLADVTSLSRSLSRSLALASTPRSSSSGGGGGFSRSSSGGGGGSRGGGGSGGRAG